MGSVVTWVPLFYEFKAILLAYLVFGEGTERFLPPLPTIGPIVFQLYSILFIIRFIQQPLLADGGPLAGSPFSSPGTSARERELDAKTEAIRRR